MQVTVNRVAGRRLQVSARGLDLVVDRLPEEGGPGDGFRPTELLLGALGACMAGTLLTFCENQSIDVDGLTVELTDTPLEAPKRIGHIKVRMTVTGDIDDRTLQTLRRVSARCKIHNTLAAGPEIEFELVKR